LIGESRTPADVVSSTVPGGPVEWVGLVVDFRHGSNDGKHFVEWICEHREFADPQKRAPGNGPIPIKQDGAGYFLVNLVIGGDPQQIIDYASKVLASPHYLYARGSVSAVVERNARPVVFLFTKEMKLGANLASADSG
jgi:hypothetical protein